MSKEEFLALAGQRYDEIKGLSSSPGFFEYERDFEGIWLSLGRDVLEKSIGAVPSNHQKKTKSRPVSGA